MGYYCTVPQCTSLAGKTKNVKFHRFPRDTHMAEKWNTILKRGKPVTIYSKVCSLHFTQADYNVTTMGQWKTLSKDAIPTQNLPKLNPDGTVMVIRKSRIVKYKDIKKEDISDDVEKWSPLPTQTEPPNVSAALQLSDPHANYIYRLQEMNAMAKAMSSSQDPLPLQITPRKPKKQDAFMQTDPIKYDEDDSQMNANFETQKSYTSDLDYQYKPLDFEESKYIAKDYTKENDYTQTNEEYNEAEKYALERKSHTAYDKIDYQKSIEYDKIPEVYTSFDEKEFETRQGYVYENSYPDSVDMLRNQQQNLQLLQDQHRVNENQNFFNENHIKQEIDFNNDEEKFLYERNKDPVVSAPNTPSTIYESPRIMDQISQQVKQEPDASNGCETVVQPQESPYYNSTEHNINGCYPQVCRPGPELLIAKQNALAAHTQLWQNTMKRPFFYSESPRYNTPTIIHRYEDLSRILQ